ncbi:hypothetical protein BDR04DRAFT_283621 [Suillus decipiens]|nr:hypothetical protein BDR04DRAFT_283621 [Suillus decipiens]
MWELEVWEVKTGIIRTFEGHSQSIICIGISADSIMLASWATYPTYGYGAWTLANSYLKFQLADVCAVGFSKKLTDISRYLEVWDVETHRLDIRLVRKSQATVTGGTVIHTPVFWTTKDKTTVTAFNFKDDDRMFATQEWHQGYDESKTIYEFDASTLHPWQHFQDVPTYCQTLFLC